MNVPMRYPIAVIVLLAAACAHQPTARERYEAGIKVGYALMENGPKRIAEADPFVVGAMEGVMRWGQDQMRKEQEKKICAVIDEVRAEREEKVRRPADFQPVGIEPQYGGMTPMHKIVDDAVRETDRQLKPLEDALSIPDDDLTP